MTIARARARVVETAPLRSIGAIHNTRARARARLVETRLYTPFYLRSCGLNLSSAANDIAGSHSVSYEKGALE